MEALAVDARISLVDALLLKEVVRVAQQRALAQESVRVSDGHSFETSVGEAVLNNDGLFLLSIGGSRIQWIPEHAREIKF